jgi:uncharacterized protein YecE (DUF72 family)
MTPSVRIGTSGWHYKHWKGTFYPERIAGDQMLAAYIQSFDTVEINNSFYRLPTEEAVKAWVKHTPADFLFSVKASRYITHNRKLREPDQSIVRFMDMAAGFGRKLGPILFQFPPSWGLNADRLDEFLRALPQRRRYTFEFRNASWLTPQVYELLRRRRCAFCIYEIAGFRSPIEVTSDFVYVRLHGPGAAYQGKYSDSDLALWAMKIEGWVRANLDVFFYFDNDQAGFAAQNALKLSGMVSGRRSKAS